MRPYAPLVSRKAHGLRLSCAFVLSIGLMGCATYTTKLKDFREALRDSRPADAAEKVKAKAFNEGDDQLVYLLEYGTASQVARNYDESNKAFLIAEELTEVKDYHSVSRVAGSLLLNEGMVQYKGDDFEKVLINGMLAINFLMQNKVEAAEVECRKLNDKLYKYRFEGKKKYQQNPFAFYLAALIWESTKDWDNAYINFAKAYELNPAIDYLKEDLLRAAKNAQREDEMAKWRKAFPKTQVADLKSLGEVVLIYQSGWGPVKRPNPSFARIPKLYPSTSFTIGARIEVEKGPKENSQEIVDITQVATAQLDEQYAALIAMRAGGIVTKAVVADQLRQRNELIGSLAWIGMNLADQADLRQWLSLPANFQIAKLRLKPGNYRIRFVGLDSQGKPTSETSPWQDVRIAARQKAFFNWRSFN